MSTKYPVQLPACAGCPRLRSTKVADYDHDVSSSNRIDDPSSVAAQTTRLQLDIVVDKFEYIVREPIRFVGQISNPGPDTLRIVDVWYLKPDMMCIYLELETPDGISETRRFSYTSEDCPTYAGEPLLPGDTVEFVIYPNVSRPVPWSVEAFERNAAHGGVTFAKRGEYKVRLVYDLRYEWRDLHGATERIISEEVRLRFREPTRMEEEILEVCWVRGGGWISMGGMCQ